MGLHWDINWESSGLHFRELSGSLSVLHDKYRYVADLGSNTPSIQILFVFETLQILVFVFEKNVWIVFK